MARIKDTDVVTVRESSRLDEVIREFVTLKPAGGGSLKGICPFHDERSPSFHVTPAKGFWHCFGCQEGGDVIDFVRKIDHLSFAEAVEKLANRAGIQLNYEEGGAAPNRQKGERTRLVEAHKAAAAFFSEQLRLPDANIGRAFLREREFDQSAAELFGIGFAPKGWDALTNHLRSQGFSDQEVITGGLAAAGTRGPYDRFRGRLVWPIRDLTGDVIGFGARRLFEDDEGPKYLNTPESPLYRKSQVLYGIDMARREISKQQRAVIVEGYTDVMAAHLSGVQTAVATCGTAFGIDHIKVLRRLLMDQNEYRGEVIFTFDGDAAGRKAALKAFGEDQRFVAQTFVAIEPDGLDPCELRLKSGPDAVKDLVESRVPLFQFVIKATLDEFNLDTAEGRVAGLRAVAPVLAGIRDQALRPEYSRIVAGWLGMETSVVSDAVRRELAQGKNRPTAVTRSAPGTEAHDVSSSSAGVQPKLLREWVRPDSQDTAAAIEREALKCAIQLPQHVAAWYDRVEAQAYTAPTYLAIHTVITSTGGPRAATSAHGWIESLLVQCPDDGLRAMVRELAVDPLHVIDPEHRTDDDETRRVYGTAVIARLLEMDATRRIVELKGRLQRTNPTQQADDYNRMFSDLLSLEQYRREMRDRGLSESPAEGV